MTDNISHTTNDDASDVSAQALRLMLSRHNVSPKRLTEPGPDVAQIQALFEAAASAPDHGEITPWRFVQVPITARIQLGEAFAQALRERDAKATLEQLQSAQEKALRAPFLALAVARLGPADPDIATLERMVSLGAAVQNILLMAHAMGFGAGLTSGQTMNSIPLRELFELDPDDQAVCFINIGTVTKPKPVRPRPILSEFVSHL